MNRKTKSKRSSGPAVHRKPLVGVIMGSKSDWETMQHTAETLEELSGGGDLTQDSNADPLEWAMTIDEGARRKAAQVLSRFEGRG